MEGFRDLTLEQERDIDGGAIALWLATGVACCAIWTFCYKAGQAVGAAFR